MPIQILPAELANQIAAGEVVERPSSVVKELVENCIDAGATKIDIDIERGGHKRIRVSDNGSGIEHQELALALSRHATSKIKDLHDLEHILSMGFRGEALASISSVARLSLQSRPEGQEQGWEAYTEGRDMQVQVHPIAHPKGTTVDVQDLFYNTPARRKFLRTEKTEFMHIDDVIKRLALCHFNIAFRLNHNGKLVRHYPAISKDSDNLKRVAQVCQKRFCEHAVWLKSEYAGMKLSGWLGLPEAARTQNDMQHAFVNQRVMRDKVVNHAIRAAFEHVMTSELYPAYVLYLDIEPERVDVNVHPAKHEVRFHQAREVHDFIYSAVLDALQSSPDEQDYPSVSGRREPNHDYIQPLQSAPNVTESRTSYYGAQETPVKHGVRTNQVPTKAPAKRDLQTFNAILNIDTPNTSLSVMLFDSQGDVLKHDGKLLYVPTATLMAFAMNRWYEQDELVQQPLLMPIAVEKSDNLKEVNIELTTQKMGMAIQLVGKKVILKAVPSVLRDQPWSQIFPEFITRLSTDEASELQLFEYVVAAQGVKDSLKQKCWDTLANCEEWTKWVAQKAIELPLNEWLLARD